MLVLSAQFTFARTGPKCLTPENANIDNADPVLHRRRGDPGVTPGVTVMEEDYKETPTEVGKSPRTKLNCLAVRTFRSCSNYGDLNTYPHDQFRT